MEELKDISLEAITIPENHIRVQSINEKAVRKLADSIREAGLMVRIIVRPIGGESYELVDGERRFRAFKMLAEEEGPRWKTIPAVSEEMDERDSIRRQVVINENRADLTPYERAKGSRLAWETGYFTSKRELAAAVGKSHSVVIREINIFDRFPNEILEGFEDGTIKQAHLYYFERLKDRQAMRKLYNAIVKDELNAAETRALANRLDERWLSGDRELLIQIAEKDKNISNLLGKEIKIADLIKKSRCILTYTDLTRFKEIVLLLADLVRSGVFHTTLSQYHQNQ